MDIAVIESQLVFFVPPRQSGSFERLASRLRENIKLPFKHPALSMPLPPNAPPEIPRVVLSTPQDDQQIQISLNRVSLVRVYSKKNTFEEAKAFTNQKIEAFADSIIGDGNSIERVALIFRFFAKVEAPPKVLIEKFNIVGLQEATELGIKYNIRRKVDGFEINDHHQYDNGIDIEDNKPGIIIVRDINTVTEKKRTFSKTEASCIFTMAINMISEDYKSWLEANKNG